MDQVLLKRLVAELQPVLVGCRTTRIHAVPRYDVVLDTNARGRRLWLSLTPDEPHLCVRNRGPGAAARPPAFAMAARKWGRGRRVSAFGLVNDDRVVRVDWDGGGALVAELVPRRATAYVLDPDDGIVAVWNPRRGRPEVGATYAPPERGQRRLPDAITEDEWSELSAVDGDSLRRELVRRILDMSPSCAREIQFRLERGKGALARITKDEHTRFLTDGPPTIHSAAPLADLRAPVTTAKLVLAPCPLAHREQACRVSYDSLIEASTVFFDLKARLQLLGNARRAVLDRVDSRRDRIQRRPQQAVDPAVAAEKAAALRRRADLLLANPSATTCGDVVEVADAYGDGDPLQIRIDPALDLATNARKFYRRAQRLEARAERDATESKRTDDNVAALTQLADAARAMSSAADVEAVLAQADALGIDVPREKLRLAEAGTGALLAETRTEEGPGRGILQVTTQAGHEILVGRSARDNDRLTHQVAGRLDWWLHAEGPGSHVVLRNPRGLEQPPPDALADAAALAAWFSKARAATKVEVRWTHAGRVRKPRGAAPGTALLDSYHSFVTAPRPPAEVGGPDGRAE